MKDQKQLTSIARIIKKWLETVKEIQTERMFFAIQITRLTSIKTLCKDRIDAEQFAIYMAKRVQQSMNEASLPEHFTVEEWGIHKKLVADAIALMEHGLQNFNFETQRTIEKLLKEIDALQGDDYRNVHWTTVHFVRSGNLLKIEYALRCFIRPDFPYWCYKLAREYAEHYEPQYGSGLIPKSVPMLLEISEFWCQHYFNQSLSEKFPKLVSELNPCRIE